MASSYEHQKLFSNDIVKQEVMVSEEGQMRLAAGTGEKWPGKEEVETDGTSMIKEEVEDERMWGYGSCPTKKNPDFGEIPEAKRRKLTSTMETDSYVTQQGLMAEVKEETALFPTAVVGKSVATAFAQAGGSLPFAKIESENQVFNAHDFFTNQAILKEELNEDGDGLDQTAHERDSEKQKDMWKVFPVDGCLEKCSSHEALCQRIHPKPMLCGLCKKTWTSAANLRRHNRSHYGAKPFKCPTCDKGFNEPYALKKHIRLHTGELAFGCDLCERKFAESSALKYHRSTHTGREGLRLHSL